MDNSTRLQYLDAMGVDVWVARHCPRPVPVQGETLEQEALEQALSPAGSPVKAQGISGLWQDLQNEVAECRQCSLCESRTRTVFGAGNPQADWLVIGEAPGQSEDLQGEPFVGVAGQLLTEMLRAMGLARDAVFITNILKCRPPNNRDPRKEEVTACSRFLQRQIEAIKPKIILAVGRVAAQNLLDSEKTIGQLRGQVHNLNGTPLVVVYHPAYLLRSLPEKRKAWQDLQLAMATYQTIKEQQ